MVEYEFVVISMNAAPSENGLSNVVKTVNWRYIAKDGFHFGEVYGSTDLSAPDPSSYIEYDGLTIETVVGWITNNVNLDHLQQQALYDLNQKKNPQLVENAVPWTDQTYTRNDQYVLVIDENIIGPFGWESAVANGVLQQNGITDFEFPDNLTMRFNLLLPFNTTRTFTDRVVLYKAAIPATLPTIDNKYLQTVTGLSWDLSSGVAQGTYVVENQNFEAIKANFKNIVFDNAFYKKQKSITVEVTDNTSATRNLVVIPADGIKNELLFKSMIIGDTEKLSCKLTFTETASLDKNELKTLILGINSYIQTVEDFETAVISSIDAATEHAGLEAIYNDTLANLESYSATVIG